MSFPETLPSVLPQLAFIREKECIGCTKCIQACPVDAIIGAAKQMHTILTIECIGCGLCLPPCPVDCIDLTAISTLSPAQAQQKTIYAKKRFDARNARLTKDGSQKESTFIKTTDANKTATISFDEITAAITRVMIKRKKHELKKTS